MKPIAIASAFGIIVCGTAIAQTPSAPPDRVLQKSQAETDKIANERPVLIKVGAKCVPRAVGDRNVTWQVEVENPTSKSISTIEYESTYYNQFGNVLAHGGGKDHVLRRVVKPHSKLVLEFGEGPIPERTANADIAVVSAEFVNVDGIK